MNKTQSIVCAFKAILFAAILFLSSCAQKAPEIPEIDYAEIWRVGQFLV